jgi:hypothetical protein
MLINLRTKEEVHLLVMFLLLENILQSFIYDQYYINKSQKKKKKVFLLQQKGNK